MGISPVSPALVPARYPLRQRAVPVEGELILASDWPGESRHVNRSDPLEAAAPVFIGAAIGDAAQRGLQAYQEVLALGAERRPRFTAIA